MIKCYCDGGCTNNGKPGAEAMGSYAIYRAPESAEHEELRMQNPLVHEERVHINLKGPATNNAAEATTLKLLLFRLQQMHILEEERVIIYCDSELIINQFYGVYQIKNKQLREIFMEIRHFLREHVPYDLELCWIPGTLMKQSVIGH